MPCCCAANPPRSRRKAGLDPYRCRCVLDRVELVLHNCCQQVQPQPMRAPCCVSARSCPCKDPRPPACAPVSEPANQAPPSVCTEVIAPACCAQSTNETATRCCHGRALGVGKPATHGPCVLRLAPAGRAPAKASSCSMHEHTPIQLEQHNLVPCSRPAQVHTHPSTPLSRRAQLAPAQRAGNSPPAGAASRQATALTPRRRCARGHPARRPGPARGRGKRLGGLIASRPPGRGMGSAWVQCA